MSDEIEIFRAHSVDKAALRRVSKSICHPRETRRDHLLFAVSIGRRSPFAVRQVPVSQAIEVMPEINSGENNPVAVIESLAPETTFMGREVTRCRHCHLNQFMTDSGMCRKCRHSMIPEPQPMVDVRPVSKPLVPTGKLDIAFAVKLLRKANGLSQPDLARRLGCPRTWISKVENRKAAPTVESIIRFAAALDATPYALIIIAEAVCAA